MLGAALRSMGDANAASTVLLMHMDGSDGSTTFTDVKGHTISVTGNAQIDTAQSKFGGASALFDGSGDYLTTPDAADLELGSNDFTLECWAYFSSSKTHLLIAKRTTDSVYGPFIWYRQVTTDKLIFRATSDGASTPHVDLVSTNAVSASAWHHLAVTRSGSTWRLFVDGVQEASTTSSISIYNNTTEWMFGGESGVAANSVNGWIDELRITKGIARYTAGFTPPLIAFADNEAVATVLLMHMDGSDGSTTFTDVKGHTITANGNAQIDTAQSKFGGASGLFDGSGDYLSTADSADFDFGSGNFTIEFWLRPTSVTGTQILCSKRVDQTVQAPFIVYLSSDTLNGRFTNTGATQHTCSYTGIATNTWYHIAFVRADSTVLLFVDGDLKQSVACSGSAYTNTASVTIAGDGGGAQPINGHIDELRITKGIARYREDFTPPVAAFPDTD